jgi:hypothetical protein
MTGFETKPFQSLRPGKDDPPPPAFLQGQLRQMDKLVILNRVRQQPSCQLGGGTCAEGTEPKLVLQFHRVASAILFGPRVFMDGVRKNIDLIGDKRDEGDGGLFTGVQGTARMTQVTKHERVPEPVMIATAALNHRDIGVR